MEEIQRSTSARGTARQRVCKGTQVLVYLGQCWRSLCLTALWCTCFAHPRGREFFFLGFAQMKTCIFQIQRVYPKVPRSLRGPSSLTGPPVSLAIPQLIGLSPFQSETSWKTRRCPLHSAEQLKTTLHLLLRVWSFHLDSM